MRKFSVILCITLILMIHLPLFAGGSRETPTQSNFYGSLGSSPSVGVGYEGAVSNSLSLGAYAGISTLPEDNFGFELLFKPRIYFGSSLERFFIGANIGFVSFDYIPVKEYYDYWGNYYSEQGYPETTYDLNLGLN